MKLAILGPSENRIGYTTKRLLEEGRKQLKVELIPLIDTKLVVDKSTDVVYNKKSLSEFDYILPRIDSRRAVIGYPVMRFLDGMDVKKPYPAETVLVAHNKFLTLEALVRKGVPVPRTYMTGSRESANEILKKQKMPIIIKLLSGFGGQGVMFIESKEAARSAMETMKTLKQEICIEEYVPNPGEDIRGIVAGEEIIASFKRVAAPDEKRANVHAGGKPVSFKLDSETQEIVLKSAEAIKSKIAAIDMIESKDGVKVIEANINPGIEGIEKATNINVAGRMMDFVVSELKK